MQEAAAEEQAKEDLSLATISKKVQPEQERYRLEYLPIPVDDAKNYVGYTVKVIRKGVQEKEYRLTGATANSVITSYSIHYTKLYERPQGLHRAASGKIHLLL